MAKENQGLQIALIIFVMLTIVLGVTTFLFFRQYEDAELRVEKEQATAVQERTVSATLLNTANRLKEIIGFAPTDEIATIDEEFNEDMKTYNETLQGEFSDYREVLAQLNGTIGQKNVSLAMAQETLRQMEIHAQGIEAAKEQQIAEFKAALDKAAADLAAARGTFNRQLQAAHQQSADVQAKLEQSRQEADLAVANIQEELLKAQQKLQRTSQTLGERNEQIGEILRPTFEAGDGHIRWVNQRNGTVWINLGQADSLRRQMTFSVYPSDTNDVNRAGKKAEIEVTELLGEHLAEARITSDAIGDPILPGDVIHTPVWAPGEKLHFALTDGMDIDGDGKSDLDTVRNLITMNDGIVDAEMDDEGNRRGSLTTKTRFLVIGIDHDENTDQKPRDERIRMRDEAKALGIGTMALPELLRQMGWKNQTPVIRFGRGANPDDFRPRPADGIPAVSSGAVSPLFEPRRPPAAARTMY